MEFYEEALSLTCDLTTTKISDNMWEVLADIYNVFERDGLDYFTDMMPALHNYVTVNLKVTILTNFAKNPRRLLANPSLYCGKRQLVIVMKYLYAYCIG